jgi:hypothetical protein
VTSENLTPHAYPPFELAHEVLVVEAGDVAPQPCPVLLRSMCRGVRLVRDVARRHQRYLKVIRLSTDRIVDMKLAPMILALAALASGGCSSTEKKLIAACEKGNELELALQRHALDGDRTACGRCINGGGDELAAKAQGDPHLAAMLAACSSESCSHGGFTDCGCLARTVTTDECRRALITTVDSVLKCKAICETEAPAPPPSAVLP